MPDSGGTWHLPRLVGLPRAMGMALLGEPVPAERAEAWGLIWRCVDDEQLMDEAQALARRLAQQATLGLGLTKRALRAAFGHSLGLPTIWVPHSHRGCRQHAPNEHALPAVLREGLLIMTGLFWDLGEPQNAAAER